jgi:hypothetical protein
MWGVKRGIFMGDLSFLAVSSLISGKKARFRVRKGHAAAGLPEGPPLCECLFCGISGLVSLIGPAATTILAFYRIDRSGSTFANAGG